ncbi:uncharacterized protein LY89DRAFT_684702 [Mollisia scopiformis]|uniref:Uncharacterized protein n=1 Tax=Mollisia scopiformis TaxID=149040 RepID=A0A194XC62_MOLSC|nr:uncharacterized protein LY89DRAFT_684702 [Mollisia scopiformis]KUJ17755.1 hypothetical protein LY89DRAFT_684702 [Mollisia scopiformis]
MLACDRDWYFLDRDSVCSQSPWFARIIPKYSRTLADISGFAVTCFAVEYVQNDIFQYVVSFLETGQYPPNGLLSREPWMYLLQHVRVYSLALRFQLKALESLASVAFQNGIVDCRPDLLDHYIDNLHLMSTLCGPDPKNNIIYPPRQSALKGCAAYVMVRLSGDLLDNANFRDACRDDSNFRVFLRAVAFDKRLKASRRGKLLQTFLKNAGARDRSTVVSTQERQTLTITAPTDGCGVNLTASMPLARNNHFRSLKEEVRDNSNNTNPFRRHTIDVSTFKLGPQTEATMLLSSGRSETWYPANLSSFYPNKFPLFIAHPIEERKHIFWSLMTSRWPEKPFV